MANREVVIRLSIPRWTRRRGAALVLALVAAGGGALASVNWTPFNNGEKLSSAKMNANLQALADATLKPHLVLNNGNVDLGVYLGIGPWTVNCGGVPCTQFTIFSTAVQAPLVVYSDTIEIRIPLNMIALLDGQG